MLAETVRDFCIDARFRQDAFVKGCRSLPRTGCVDALRRLRFVLLTQPEAASLKLAGPLGQTELPRALYLPVFEALAADGGKSKSSWPRGLEASRLVEALVLLTATDSVAPALDDADRAAVESRTAALNTALMEHEAKTAWLASPVTGCGVPVDREELVFLACRPSRRDRRAGAAWRALSAADAPADAAMADGITGMRRRHDAFRARHLSVLPRLGVT